MTLRWDWTLIKNAYTSFKLRYVIDKSLLYCHGHWHGLIIVQWDNLKHLIHRIRICSRMPIAVQEKRRLTFALAHMQYFDHITATRFGNIHTKIYSHELQDNIYSAYLRF